MHRAEEETSVRFKLKLGRWLDSSGLSLEAGESERERQGVKERMTIFKTKIAQAAIDLV